MDAELVDPFTNCSLSCIIAASAADVAHVTTSEAPAGAVMRSLLAVAVCELLPNSEPAACAKLRPAKSVKPCVCAATLTPRLRRRPKRPLILAMLWICTALVNLIERRRAMRHRIAGTAGKAVLQRCAGRWPVPGVILRPLREATSSREASWQHIASLVPLLHVAVAACTVPHSSIRCLPGCASSSLPRLAFPRAALFAVPSPRWQRTAASWLCVIVPVFPCRHERRNSWVRTSLTMRGLHAAVLLPPGNVQGCRRLQAIAFVGMPAGSTLVVGAAPIGAICTVRPLHSRRHRLLRFPHAVRRIPLTRLCKGAAICPCGLATLWADAVTAPSPPTGIVSSTGCHRIGHSVCSRGACNRVM